MKSPKKTYEGPQTWVFEMKAEGMLCASETDALFSGFGPEEVLVLP